jgi:hypothetical protein
VLDGELDGDLNREELDGAADGSSPGTCIGRSSTGPPPRPRGPSPCSFLFHEGMAVCGGARGKWTEVGQTSNRHRGGWARGEGRGRGAPAGGRQGRWLWDVGELANLFFPHGALVTLSLAGTFKKAGGAGPTCYREEAS